MELTLKLELSDATYALLRELLDKGGIDEAIVPPVAQPIASLTPIAPMPVSQPAAPVIPTQVPSQPASPIVPVTPVAPSVPQQLTQQPAAPAPTVMPQSITLDMLSKAASPLVDAGKSPELLSLLAKYNVRALTELPQTLYAPFAADLRALGARI